MNINIALCWSWHAEKDDNLFCQIESISYGFHYTLVATFMTCMKQGNRNSKLAEHLFVCMTWQGILSNIREQ